MAKNTDIYKEQLKPFVNVVKTIKQIFPMCYIYDDGYIYGPPMENFEWIISVAKSSKPITAYHGKVINTGYVYDRTKDLKITYTNIRESNKVITIENTRDVDNPAVLYPIEEPLESFIDNTIDKAEIYRYLIDKENLNAVDYEDIPADGIKDIVNGLMYEHECKVCYFRLTKDIVPYVKKDTMISFRHTKSISSPSPKYNKTYLTFRSETPSLNIIIYSMICIRTVNKAYK